MDFISIAHCNFCKAEVEPVEDLEYTPEDVFEGYKRWLCGDCERPIILAEPSDSYWRRYNVKVIPDNHSDREPVLDRWFVNFDNMKKELRELTVRHGWEGYHVDIREYRHNPSKWVWRSKL